jgi:hypothetical protein
MFFFFIFSSTANLLGELRINTNYELHHPDEGLGVGGIFSNATNSLEKGGSARHLFKKRVLQDTFHLHTWPSFPRCACRDVPPKRMGDPALITNNEYWGPSGS